MLQAIAIKEVPFFGKNVEITALSWNFDEAIVEIFCPELERELKVRFNNEFGHCALRLLDESDLSENWKVINMGGGWLYKVNSGGWFEQESQREGFLMQHASHIYKEYLIVGLDACISVFTKEDVALVEGDAVVYTVST